MKFLISQSTTFTILDKVSVQGSHLDPEDNHIALVAHKLADCKGLAVRKDQVVHRDQAVRVHKADHNHAAAVVLGTAVDNLLHNHDSVCELRLQLLMLLRLKYLKKN